MACALDCDDPASWVGNERRLTDESFDYLEAPEANGLFLGDYMGLAVDDLDFVAVYGQSGIDGDPASMFFQRVAP